MALGFRVWYARRGSWCEVGVTQERTSHSRSRAPVSKTTSLTLTIKPYTGQGFFPGWIFLGGLVFFSLVFFLFGVLVVFARENTLS